RATRRRRLRPRRRWHRPARLEIRHVLRHRRHHDGRGRRGRRRNRNRRLRRHRLRLGQRNRRRRRRRDRRRRSLLLRLQLLLVLHAVFVVAGLLLLLRLLNRRFALLLEDRDFVLILLLGLIDLLL